MAVAIFKGPTWYLDKANKHGVKKVIFSQLLVEHHTNYCQVMHANHFTVSTSDTCYVPSPIHQQLLCSCNTCWKVQVASELGTPITLCCNEQSLQTLMIMLFSKIPILSKHDLKEEPPFIYTPNWNVMYMLTATRELE